MKIRSNLAAIISMAIFTYLNAAYAKPNPCTLNGSWSIEYGMKMEFAEINKEVTLMTPLPHPICGDMIVKGYNDGKNFTLHLITSHPDCKTSMKYEGTFTNESCHNVVGKVVVQEEGQSEMKYPFRWYRDNVKNHQS